MDARAIQQCHERHCDDEKEDRKDGRNPSNDLQKKLAAVSTDETLKGCRSQVAEGTYS